MEVKVTLRNPQDHNDLLDYYIIPDEHQLAHDWIRALKEILSSNLSLQKEFCFLGFPNSARTIEYLCDELNRAVKIINSYDFTQHGLKPYIIEEYFTPDSVRFSEELYPIGPTGNDSIDSPDELGLRIKHSIMNQLHNHFELLEGTVEHPSPYGQNAPVEVRQAIGQLNYNCHELESLILSQRKYRVTPEWVRPSQITTFESCRRYDLTDEHRQGFLINGYDRLFGHVYMHWTQIGKTLFEVFRDEGAPDLDDTACEAITHLQYYSGEFDVEWAKSVTKNSNYSWHDEDQLQFENWLLKHGFDPRDPKLSLGYLHIGQVDLERSFGTEDMFEIWNLLGTHLGIYSIEVDGIKQVFDYCWSDKNEMD